MKFGGEIAKILPKHQITLPKEVREALELEIVASDFNKVLF